MLRLQQSASCSHLFILHRPELSTLLDCQRVSLDLSWLSVPVSSGFIQALRCSGVEQHKSRFSTLLLPWVSCLPSHQGGFVLISRSLWKLQFISTFFTCCASLPQQAFIPVHGGRDLKVSASSHCVWCHLFTWCYLRKSARRSQTNCCNYTKGEERSRQIYVIHFFVKAECAAASLVWYGGVCVVFQFVGLFLCTHSVSLSVPRSDRPLCSDPAS